MLKLLLAFSHTENLRVDFFFFKSTKDTFKSIYLLQPMLLGRVLFLSNALKILRF